MKREESPLVQIACDKSKDIYKLEDEERGKFISREHIQQIQEPRTLTNWNIEKEGSLSVQFAYDKSEVNYKLEGEEEKNTSTQIICDKSKVTYILEDKGREVH